jgi:hypothetical protein
MGNPEAQVTSDADTTQRAKNTIVDYLFFILSSIVYVDYSFFILSSIVYVDYPFFILSSIVYVDYSFFILSSIVNNLHKQLKRE